MKVLVSIASLLDTQAYKVIWFVVVGFFLLITRIFIKRYLWNHKKAARKEYYRNVYLKSEAWQRKRYVVLKRDNWTCLHCGAKASQVHHKRYAKRNIGKEPIAWLESICKKCHEELH